MTTQTKPSKLTFTCPVDALLEATAKLLAVVPAKSPKPVLSNIHFSVRDGSLELSGTDFSAGIHYAIPAAEVATEGSGLLNAARFSELLKEFRGAEGKLAFNPKGGCQFRAKGGRYKVTGDDIRDYPKARRFEDKPGLEITGAELVDMIKKTAFAAAPEESRLTINGVLFEFQDKRLRLVATDNKRMAITELPVDSDLEPFSVSVPQSFLKAVIKVCTKDVAGKPAVLGVTKTKVFFRLPTSTVYASVLQGNYPPYQEALGIRLDHYIECSTNELLSTIRRAMLANSGLTAFIFSEDLMTLEASSSAYGAGSAMMETKLQLPEEIERIRVGFNPSYFKEALEAMTAKRCRFYFQGPKNAGVLKEILTVKEGEGDDAVEKEVLSEKFTYAVMPALLPRE